ncbi:hypothetical protein ACFWDQ_34600 [Streptomyces sp. NPDC060053]|uniref:hypothetical protein n=1 Tax=Streptomyces sp. NPDC060053 TaxID=3347047 RepID=UPI00368272F6
MAWNVQVSAGAGFLGQLGGAFPGKAPGHEVIDGEWHIVRSHGAFTQTAKAAIAS